MDYKANGGGAGGQRAPGASVAANRVGASLKLYRVQNAEDVSGTIPHTVVIHGSTAEDLKLLRAQLEALQSAEEGAGIKAGVALIIAKINKAAFGPLFTTVENPGVPPNNPMEVEAAAKGTFVSGREVRTIVNRRAAAAVVVTGAAKLGAIGAIGKYVSINETLAAQEAEIEDLERRLTAAGIPHGFFADLLEPVVSALQTHQPPVMVDGQAGPPVITVPPLSQLDPAK